MAIAATAAAALSGLAAAPAGAATAGTPVTCNVTANFVNYFGGYFEQPPASPYTVDITKTGPDLQVCFSNGTIFGGGTEQIIQNGTERCLTLDTSNRTVEMGDCHSPYSTWDQITITTTGSKYFGDVTLENSDNKACIWQGTGIGAPATYNPCNAGQSGDIWQTALG